MKSEDIYILGLNAYHGDSAAALIKNGKLVTAVEEERFTRIKHECNFPVNAIKFCLKKNKISISEVNHISINSNPKSNFLRKISHTLKNQLSLKLIKDKLTRYKKKTDFKEQFKKLFPKQKITASFHNLEHHNCHLASSYYSSGWDNSVVLSVDGFGDFSSAAWGIGEFGNLKTDGYIYFPDSLGIFYSAITQYLGFKNFGDEYKLMGLAPYGYPRYLHEMKKIINIKDNGLFKLNPKYFIHHKKKVDFNWEKGSPRLATLYSNELPNLFNNKPREEGSQIDQFHKDLASSVQFIYERGFFNLLNMIEKKYKLDSLCLAGGCAANSVANGKITKFTNFKNIYIHSSPGDAGGAVGAAYITWNKYISSSSKPIQSAYLGPDYSSEEISNLLNNTKTISYLENENCTVENFDFKNHSELDHFLNKVVSRILEGGVIGWFQGSMEWGPRALGNRSILGDPRNKEMKKILNKKIKKRESFRPFAPSILKDHINDWFEVPNDCDIDVPYMMKVLPIRAEKRILIPAVCHVDGSGRLQTVTESSNALYYKLIKKFHEKTQVPMLLNTSFNENEPIVCKPREALDCFLRTKMDLLVLNNFLISRPNNFKN